MDDSLHIGKIKSDLSMNKRKTPVTPYTLSKNDRLGRRIASSPEVLCCVIKQDTLPSA